MSNSPISLISLSASTHFSTFSNFKPRRCYETESRRVQIPSSFIFLKNMGLWLRVQSSDQALNHFTRPDFLLASQFQPVSGLVYQYQSITGSIHKCSQEAFGAVWHWALCLSPTIAAPLLLSTPKYVLMVKQNNDSQSEMEQEVYVKDEQIQCVSIVINSCFSMTCFSSGLVVLVG